MTRSENCLRLTSSQGHPVRSEAWNRSCAARTALLRCRALEVCLGHHFQRLDVERLISDDLLEAAILIFKLFEPLQIATSRPPYFARQLDSVEPEMPCLRQNRGGRYTGPQLLEDANRICDSVKRDWRM